jgi:4-amino-4-deoxy-L-arabinose transferase-like glycosyltransferase
MTAGDSRVADLPGMGAGQSRVSRRVALVSAAALSLVMGAVFGQGFIASDDVSYAQIAASYMPSEFGAPVFKVDGHHDSRLGLTYPLAAAFSIFGVSEASLALLPFACTVLTAILVAWLGCRFYGNTVGLLAGLVFSFIPLTVNLATVYVPEPIATFEMSLAAAVVVAAAGREGWSRSSRLVAAGVIAGLAYMSTEVGALMIPVLYCYLAFRRRLTLADAGLLTGFLIVFSAEMGYHSLVHGQALHRFLGAGAYVADPMVGAANADLVYRLFKAYPRMFLIPGLVFGLMGPLLIAAGIWGLRRIRDAALFVLWAAAIVLFYNFMSASLTRYVALPVAGRLLAPAMAPLAVLLGLAVADLWTWMGRFAVPMRNMLRVAAGAALSVTAAGSIFCDYLKIDVGWTLAIGRTGKTVAEHLRRYPSVTVVSDAPSARVVQFFRGFGKDDSFVRFASLGTSDELGQQRASARPVFVVVNGVVSNQESLTGVRYGDSWTREDSTGLERLRGSFGAEVLSYSIRHHPRRLSLSQSGPGMLLLGNYLADVARAIGNDPRQLGAVRVFQLDVPSG